MKRYRIFIIVTLLFSPLLIFSQQSIVYNKSDLDNLRTFLRQSSSVNGKCNYHQFWLTEQDTLTWYENFNWINKTQTKWDVIGDEYRLSQVNWYGSQLGGNFNFSDCEYLQDINIGSNPAIREVVVLNNKKLKKLVASETGISQLVLTENYDLEELTLFNTSVPEIDIKKNPNLRMLDIGSTEISTINVSANPLLERLYCMECKRLVDVDFSTNLSLIEVNISDCPQVKSIDLSGLGNLEIFHCKNSGLTELNLRSNSKIKKVFGSNSGLEKLSFPENVPLEVLVLDNNRLDNIAGLESCLNLQILDIRNNRFSSLDVSGLMSLVELKCSGNRMERIVGLESLKKIIRFDCHDNLLTDLNGLPTKELTELYAQNNCLKFSTLPIRAKEVNSIMTEIAKYQFYPQSVVNGGAVQVGDEIDLTGEASKTFGSETHNTIFSWFEINGDSERPIELHSSKDGLFSVSSEFSGKRLRCKMTNPFFYFNDNRVSETDFPIVYELFVVGNEEYDQFEISQIKDFLRQESSVKNMTNAAILNLDTLSWNKDNLWLYRIPGLQFSEGKNCRIKSIDWKNRRLAGSLNVAEFDSLAYLDVSDNFLTDLNINDCQNLQSLYCQNNNLRFSTLPVCSVPVYYMAPQRVIEGGIVIYGESVDLRNEAVVRTNTDTYQTRFVWKEVKNEGESELSDVIEQESGYFSLNETHKGKILRCYMFNEVFWGEIPENQLSIVYEIQVSQNEGNLFDKKEISALKSFLRQSSESGICNFTKLDMDTLNWNNSNDWLVKIPGVKWIKKNETSFVKEISWVDCGLVGNMELSGFLYLDVLKISGNNLQSIRLDNDSNLKELYAFDNYSCSELFLGGCSSLQKLYVQNCNLEKLDLSDCMKMNLIMAFNNVLSVVNLSGKNELKSAYLYDNKLTSITLDGCTELANLDVSNNQLSCLDISSCTGLDFLKCDGNRLKFSTLPKAQISSYGYSPQATIYGDSIYFTDDLDLSSERFVQREGGEMMKTQFLWFDITTGIPLACDSAVVVSESGIVTFDEDLSGRDLRCVMTNKAFPELQQVFEVCLEEDINRYDANEISDLREFLRQESSRNGISNAVAALLTPIDTLSWELDGKWLVRMKANGLLDFKQIQDGDIRKNRLSWVSFIGGLSGDLLLPHCTYLEELRCVGQELTSLDVSNSVDLKVLDVTNNHLKSIDVSKLNKLKYFYCDMNEVESLVFDNHPELLMIWAGNNNLSSINVSGASNLTVLRLMNNHLTELDVTRLTKLEYLFIANNELQDLDLTNNPELSHFYASNNQFTYFDFGTYNKKMWKLFLDHNRLKGIKLTGLVIEETDIRYNKLTYSTIPFDFSRKYYYFAPQDTVNLGNVSKDAVIDISSEYMLEVDGTHTYYEWKVWDGTDFIETNDVIVVDETGIFRFEETAVGKQFKCILTNDNPVRGQLVLEYFVNVTSASGMEDDSDGILSWNVYPNPTDGMIYITSEYFLNEVKVYDITGRIVYASVESGQKHITLDLTNYSSGTYFVEINGQVKKVIRK